MSDFDDHASSYEREIADAISFSGTDPAFFLELKADLLLDLSGVCGATRRRRACSTSVAAPAGWTRTSSSASASLAGVDTSERMVELAAAANPGAEYAVTEPLRLPYPDALVRRRRSRRASCTTSSPATVPPFVAEMARVVAPGGLVVVLEHNPLNPLTRFVVSRCALDEGVELFGPGAARALLAAPARSRSRAGTSRSSRGARRFLRRVEAALRRLPLGAQYASRRRR